MNVTSTDKKKLPAAALFTVSEMEEFVCIQKDIQAIDNKS